MKRERVMPRLLAATAAMLIGAGCLLPGSAAAQAPADEWQFNALIYGYLPTVGGSTVFPAGTGSSISVNPSKIIGSLKFAFMGSLEAQKGNWGAFTDVMYLDIGGSKSGTRDLSVGDAQLPVGVTANANLDVKGTIWTLGGSYRAITTPEGTLDLLAGARLLSVSQRLGWSFSADVGPFAGPGREGNIEAKADDWDAIVGVKGHVRLGAGSKWFVPYYLDVGTGDSDLTWQGVGGLGYAFDWGELNVTWRYLDYQFKSGSKLETLNFSGPMAGVAFRW